LKDFINHFEEYHCHYLIEIVTASPLFCADQTVGLFLSLPLFIAFFFFLLTVKALPQSI
jgi:hypothetical protein